MKPVLILQNQTAAGPAYLAQWLREQGVPFEARNAEASDACPTHLHDHGALVILGGEMSANDPLPFLRRTEDLIRLALRDGVPMLGHCLGGQLMARALGARVTASPAPEIGWQPMEVLDTPDARAWLGEPGRVHVFHWHHDAFELPPGAQRLAESAACPNQAFAIGPHLAMQFHVEIDHDGIMEWSQDQGPRYLDALAHHATVQTRDAMRAAAAVHLAQHQALARRIYGRWLTAAPRQG
jgi:GMP synthase-like glutamine amidotransferase